MTFLYRSDCKDCEMVKKWLDKHGVEYTSRDMDAEPPTAEELIEWSDIGKFGLKAFLQPRKFSLKMMFLNHQMVLAERYARALIMSAAHEHIVCPIMVGDDFVVMGTENSQWRRALNIVS